MENAAVAVCLKTAVVRACLLAFIAGPALAAGLPYGVGQWEERGQGNHRAVLRVTQKADAVRAHIEWRRRDQNPERKDIRIVDLTTGERVLNRVCARVERESGDLIFQPATVPGEYAVYYLPYNPGTGNFDDPGTYFEPEHTAEADWIARNRLSPQALESAAWESLPRAEVLRIEARGEFHRMDPMEVIATRAETQAVLAAHPEESYLLFPEDRKYPIRMFEDIPLKWAVSGPSTSFEGTAQPGEYYVFQVGVWAARKAVPGLDVDLPALSTDGGKRISRSQVTCFNLCGRDWLGRPMRRDFAVAQGQVRALWFGIQIPQDAEGVYRGTFTIRPEGAPPCDVAVQIDVAGPVLADGGVNDLWRMSRLKWLNSRLGLDEEVIPPYTPLEVNGDTIRCLQREVRFGQSGLPDSIISKGRNILAAPMRLVAESPGGTAPAEPPESWTVSKAPGVVRRVTRIASPQAATTVECAMEADGCVQYRVRMKAEREIDLSDVRLEIPLKREVARYMMGFGRRGGYRPESHRWKWDIERADNQVWLGDADGGVQLYLQGPRDVWDVISLVDSGLPDSWNNGGKGGCDVIEQGDTVLVRAYTGERTLAPGEELELRFRLLITPFRPLDKRHWNWRYGDVNRDGNILHIHHATGENPYINYPFIEWKRLKETVDRVKSTVKRTDEGSLTYPALGNINPDRGSLHLRVTLDFDPRAGEPRQARFNQSLFGLDWPNQDQVGFYWNVDDRGMRAYIRQGAPELNQYPVLFGTHLPGWEQGQQHTLTLSWGDTLAVFVDGELRGSAPHTGTLQTPLDGAVLRLNGSGFILDAIKVSDAPYSEGQTVQFAPDEHTLLLDTFENADAASTRPQVSAGNEPGQFKGVVELSPGDAGHRVAFSSRTVEGATNGVNLYYTVRELSNHVAEMWPLRSLGDEVFQGRSAFIYSVEKTMFGTPGGGYPWLQEHLVSGYVPAWRQPLWNGDHDAAIATQGLSRWHNYYVEGMRWLMQETGIDGLYLDGIGYDREIMKRIAKVMHANNPDYRINFHSGNNYDFMDRHTSPANSYMEHFPYVSNLWFGEMYDYNRAPDYWFVEISGIPFGLTSEMLEYQTGGNPYRGMIYGMTGRLHPSCSGMWRFWDEFGIQDAEWLGYWSPDCPVRTDRADVLATAYRKKGQTLISLAHWPTERPRPGVTAQAATGAPAMDGRLSPGEWDLAARMTGFTIINQDQRAPLQTEAYATWDSERLYVAFRCNLPKGFRPLARVTERDGSVWEDDAIELFIQPDPDRQAYYQLVGNSAGAFYDGKGLGGADWDGEWQYAASAGEGGWEAEASIPWASLGMNAPEAGTTLGINVCRDQQTPSKSLSCWAPVGGSFHDPEQFGRLTLSTGAPSTRQSTDEPAAADMPKVRLQIDWQALGLDPAKAKLTAPAIQHFQGPAEFRPTDAIPFEPGKGWLLIAHE